MAWYEFWKRDTEDPLMKSFVDKYKLHLLPVPRNDIFLCDIFIQDKNGMSGSGSIVDFLEPEYEIPPTRNGTMADLSGQLSRSVSFDVGVGLLEGFLSAFGIGAIIQNVKVGYKNKGTQYMKFRFTTIQHDTVSAIKAAKNLINHTIVKNHPFYDINNKYYLVTALARTPSISIVAENNNHQTIDIDLTARGIANASIATNIVKSGSGELTYSGKDSLVFGAEVHELSYSADTKNFKMHAMNKFVNLKGSESDDQRRPSLIGDEKQGDIFWEIVKK